ncbi:alpha/beta-hydrolase, partial [Mollisia scopiformis]
LGGGLTILSYNDLNNTPSLGSGAILINQASSFASASQSCNLLGERFWAPANETPSELNNSLSYQVYLGAFPEIQLFWISNSTSRLCRAINYLGSVSNVDCGRELPALCSQSAPVSNSTFTNTSATFQIAQQVGAVSITGYRDFYTWKFFGIRYAAKPERFTYSSVFAGTGQELAISQPPACQQYIGQVTSGSSEDCLFLNIWTPYLAPTSPAAKANLKPVMFYIYGGGFTSGAASDPNTDGTNLASRGDVVVVALNYRIGYFGFLAYPDGVHNGNYGIGDMVTALEWVSQNIRAFGGDPEQVTIFGQSAGAAAARTLLASPKTKGLFSNAIMQSTPDGWPLAAPIAHYMSVQEYYTNFTESALNSTGCLDATDPIACLSEVDAAVLANLQTAAQYPVVDGTYLTSAELALNNSSGHNSNISVIVGGVRDEFAILDTYYPPAGITIEQYFDALSSEDFTQYPVLTNGTALFSIPPNPTADEIFNITVRVGTDGLFNCALEAAAYSAAKNNVFKKVYSYQFNRTYSPTDYTTTWCSAPLTASRPFGDPEMEYYKCHAGEQLYTFGTMKWGLPDRDGLDVLFSQWVVDYWTAFAWTGNPNPKKEYLEARGYWSTLERISKTGVWDQVAVNSSAWRVMQWDGFMAQEYPEQEQCAFLGLPLD